MHGNDDQIEAASTRSLEAAPEITVPADFAKRVMARLPVRRFTAPTRASNAARNAAITSMIALACILLVLVFAAPQTRFVSFALEPLLALQLGGLIFWQAVRPRIQ